MRWRIPLPQDRTQRTLALAIVTSVLFHLFVLVPFVVMPGLPTALVTRAPVFGSSTVKVMLPAWPLAQLAPPALAEGARVTIMSYGRS